MGREAAIRRATAHDLPAILALARQSLGWTDDTTDYLEWKHLQNPFGPSAMWVAEAGGDVVGFRAFLRWEFDDPEVDGQGDTPIRAVRAVDTATAPSHQGQGIFTRLTLAGIEELRAEGVAFVFNTPNRQSRPGYLKMGWHDVGRMPVVVRPNRWRFARSILTARGSAGREPVLSDVGEPAASGLTDVAALVAAPLARPGLSTRRSAEFLRWRYGNPSLGYRTVRLGAVTDGVVIFRLRSRGDAIEATVCDVLVPGDDTSRSRALVAAVAGERRADYLIRLRSDGVAARGFVPLPRMGPVLTCRPLADERVPPRSAWSLSLGDVELL
jgi:predicted N-acetyltransferase YhbS